MTCNVNARLAKSFAGMGGASITLPQAGGPSAELRGWTALSAASRSPQPAFLTLLVASLALASLALAPAARAEDPPHAGFLCDRFPLTVEPGERTEAAGPFFYSDVAGSAKTWAIPPLFAVSHIREADATEFRLLYPLVSYIRYGRQYRWHFLQFLSFAGGPTQTETKRSRITLFPFYFQQRSSDPAENYTAYGPFYGHLKGRLFRDEISYVMFPAYSETRKGDVATVNYFYPFFHVRQGAGLSGWQFWPLTGHEHKVVTTRTNRFHEVETVPGHDDWFVLWPLFFAHRGGIGSTNPAWQQGVLPFYALARSPQRDSTTLLWPLFSRVDDREQKYREWDLPWPFVVSARGPGKHTSRVWPFYSHAYSSNFVSDFVLWPLYKHNRTRAAPLDSERTRILFYLHSDVTDYDTESRASRRRVDLWPFFTYHRELNGNRRLQVLALLESMFPDNPGIEREYAPIYSLWRWERNPKTGASSQSLLWNLYRRETTRDSRKVSALFGLYQRQTGPNGKRLSLFFVPLGGGP